MTRDTPTAQAYKDHKGYHVTYNCNEYNAKIEGTPYENDYQYFVPDSKHIEDLLVDTRCGINTVMPYLWVFEIGTTGKAHYHCYFFSTKSRNTVKKWMYEHCKATLQVSDPFDDKYNKHAKDGVYGVEIYLHKGKTNHMSSNDDLKVIPHKICSNLEYYGDINNETSRSYKIRKMYENIIQQMKKYTSEVRKISENNKLTEIQTILKDLSDKSILSGREIKDYLIDVHYMRPKYIYSENGFKRIFLKILREKNPKHYKEIIKQSMDSVLSNAFKL